MGLHVSMNRSVLASSSELGPALIFDCKSEIISFSTISRILGLFSSNRGLKTLSGVFTMVNRVNRSGIPISQHLLISMNRGVFAFILARRFGGACLARVAAGLSPVGLQGS
jgi:hypothetical protein